eukprot:m.18895 g.18895  ORF g.18895 m.18895 type:complete len:72 (+) comp3380_c0_seq1:490-705(+)
MLFGATPGAHDNLLGLGLSMPLQIHPPSYPIEPHGSFLLSQVLAEYDPTLLKGPDGFVLRKPEEKSSSDCC